MKALEKLKKILEKYSLESLNKDMTLAYNNALFELEEILEEDMAVKRYTEEDLREAIDLARKTKVNVWGAHGEESLDFAHNNNEILKIVAKDRKR